MSSYTVLPFKGPELPDEFENLILSRWMRSLRYTNDYYKLIHPDSYYAVYQRIIKSILSRLETTVALAVLTDDHDIVLGFSVSRGNILDFIHVHKHQRRLGIGRTLIPDGIDTITHLTHTGMSIWASKYGHWKFNPFA